MIRANKKFLDIQNCIFEMIKYKCDNTAPWTSWQPLLGYPESEQFEEFTKPFIYIESPVPVDTKWQQAGRSLNFLEMIIGIWTDRKTGGEEEITIMESYLFDLFTDPQSVHASSFDVVTDASYTNTTLIDQGIRIMNFGSLQDMQMTEDIKEFRKEGTLLIKI